MGENRSMNKNIKGIKVKYILIVISLVISILAIYCMNLDHYWSGDEVITYSMANSDYDGWMLSGGRVSDYVKNEILGETFSKTLDNFVDFVKDLMIHGNKAAYFSYPRPAETGWYHLPEVQDWFQVQEKERFHYGSVYVNAMGDDANSFLYYSLVHTVGSFFTHISGTAWAAFIVNLIALLVTVLLLWKISCKMGISQERGLAAVICYGTSGACLLQVTTLRAYMAASVFQLAMFLLHLDLLEAVETEDRTKIKKIMLWAIPVYVFGYVTHYTMLFWAAVLGLNTVICLLKKKNAQKRQWIKRYIMTGGGCDPLRFADRSCVGHGSADEIL